MVAFTLLYSAIEFLSENRQTGFLDCINVALGISIGKLPNSNIVRIIFIIFTIYSMHIHIFYQSQLIIMLTTPVSEKQITTPEELIASKVHFGFPRSFEVHLERMNSTNAEYFLKNNKGCEFGNCIQEMHKRPFATLGNKMYLQYSIAFEHRNVKFYTITNPVAKSFVEMIMTKGFPLRDKINLKLRRMIELGYLAGCQEVYKKWVANVSIYNREPYRTVNYLETEHFLSAFLLYAIGMSMAIITFTVELLMKYYKSNTYHI